MRYKSRFSYLLEFLHAYLVLLSLMTIPIGLQTDADPYWLLFKTGFILFAVVVLFFAERRCRTIVTFSLICLPLLAIPYLIQSGPIDFFYQLSAVVILIITYVVCRLGSSTPWVQEPSIYFEILFLVIYFLGIYLDNTFIQNCMVYYAMGYLLLMLLYTNSTNMGNFLKLNREVANLPAGQIKSVNRIILLILSLITIAAMILVPISGLGTVIQQIGYGLFQLVKWLFHFLSSDGGEEPPSSPLPKEKIDIPESTEETSTFISWLLQILTVIAVFITVAAVLAAVIYAIYTIIRRFYRPAKDGDETLFLTKTPVDEIRATLPGSPLQKAERLGRDPNGTVRRIYKKIIRKHASGTPPSSFTPKELEAFSKLPDSEETKTLHHLYEQARYSEQGVTKEDAASAKSLHIS